MQLSGRLILTANRDSANVIARRQSWCRQRWRKHNQAAVYSGINDNRIESGWVVDRHNVNVRYRGYLIG
jgi:hypothetical protein